MTHWQVEPWDEAVDGKILFRALYECVRRYVILTEPQATAVTLWVVYSWLHEHERFATHSPVLLVRSAEKDSGKTTLLGDHHLPDPPGAEQRRDQRGRAVPLDRQMAADLRDRRGRRRSDRQRRSAQRLEFRMDPRPDRHPLPSRHPRAGIVLDLRPQGARHEGRQAARHHAEPLARDRHEAEADRRRIADFDHLDNETFARLRRQVLRWATDNAEALAARQPEIPQDFHNRRRANWRPLLAIAEAMDMKQAGWEAALEIERRQIAVDPSTGIQLLTAIRFIFDEMKADRLVTGQADKDRHHHRCGSCRN